MSTPSPRVVNVFFVASPLNYLAARRVALDHEAGTRCVVVYYRDMSAALIDASPWDAVLPIAWPRLAPLPGRFGRVRRLVDNLEKVAAAVGPCEEIRLHSPVFEPEIINYFVRGLPKMTGARRVRGRLLPDGMDSLRRYPMGLGRVLTQCVRRLRWFYDHRLVYTVFTGDRMGSDASFVDRIYVLNGFPHPYPPAKVVELAPLVARVSAEGGQPAGPRRALVLGQPLASAGFLTEAQRAQMAEAMAHWLAGTGVQEILYKAHPREATPREFLQPGYRELVLNEPLEAHLAHERYEVVCSCASTALITARQIQGQDCRIASFGLEWLRNLDANARDRMHRLMQAFSVEVYTGDGEPVPARS